MNILNQAARIAEKEWAVFTPGYGTRVGALNPQDLPWLVFPDEMLQAKLVKFKYRGGAGIIVYHWALKAGADFANGKGIAAGAWGWAPITVPLCVSYTDRQAIIPPERAFKLSSDVPPAVYDAWTWFTWEKASTMEADFISPIDLDNRVFNVGRPSVSEHERSWYAYIL